MKNRPFWPRKEVVKLAAKQKPVKGKVKEQPKTKSGKKPIKGGGKKY